MRFTRVVCSALATAALMGGAATVQAQASVTIRPDSVYQTFEGFGAHGSMDVWWGGGPFYNQTFLNFLVDDMGMTMNRNEFYPDYEATNDNSDPNVLGSFNTSTNAQFVGKQKAWIQALKAKADASGQPMRFIATYWSPPGWMKVNNSTVGGVPATNVLRVGMEAELGELGVATVKAYKDQCGVDLYALSMQNEPAFDEPYNSCIYSPTRYRDVFKVFGPRVHATYPNVKLFGTEHMLANWGTMEGQIITDSLAKAHMDAFAVHGYSDGVHPTPASSAVNLWKRAATNTTGAKRPLWMTETSGYFDTWTDCFHLAEMMYAAVRHGRLAAWVWWQLSEPSSNEYAMMNSGQPSKRAYIHKHFAKFMRPEAVMIGAPLTGDSLVFAIAVHHRANQTLSVLLLNAASGSRTVNLSTTLGTLPQFTVYRTSASENCASAGTATGSVTLPASTVTTLFATGYNPPVSVVDPATGRINPNGYTSFGTAKVYSMDGRLVAAIDNARMDHGKVAWDGRDAQGARVARGAYYASLIDQSGAVKAERLPVRID